MFWTIEKKAAEAGSRVTSFWGILKPKMLSLGVLRSHGSLEPLELKRRGDVAWLTIFFMVSRFGGCWVYLFTWWFGKGKPFLRNSNHQAPSCHQVFTIEQLEVFTIYNQPSMRSRLLQPTHHQPNHWPLMFLWHSLRWMELHLLVSTTKLGKFHAWHCRPLGSPSRPALAAKTWPFWDGDVTWPPTFFWMKSGHGSKKNHQVFVYFLDVDVWTFLVCWGWIFQS